MDMAQGEEFAQIATPRAKRASVMGDSDLLARGTALYLAFGSLFLLAVDASPLDVIRGLETAFSNFFRMAAAMIPWWALPVVLAPLALSGRLRRHLWAQRSPLLLSIMLCGLFTFMFGLVKNRMSLVVPFWADDIFTQVDLALHFGHSPRDLLLWLSPFGTEGLLKLYFSSWVFLATFFPVLLIAFDADRDRRRVFTLLWMFCWIGLGNVFAIVGMSYGPIFADLFPNGPAAAHQGALDMLQREDARRLLATKMFLWRAYTGESPTLGSGISAFPSVHVGMATLIGIYLARRGADAARAFVLSAGRRLALIWGTRLIGGIYVATYVILSVYLGWHYAVDGYASILLIGTVYALLATRFERVPARRRSVLQVERA